MPEGQARRAVVTLVAMLAVVAVAGCGDDEKRDTGASTSGSTTGAETGEAKAPAGPVADTVTVKETEYKLTPANPKVAKGGTVEFVAKNDGKIEHALEVEGPDGEAQTEPIAPGKPAKLKVKLDKPGSYTWYCPLDAHRQKGMVGKITVGGAGGGAGASAPSEPKQDAGGSSGGSGSGY